MPVKTMLGVLQAWVVPSTVGAGSPCRQLLGSLCWLFSLAAWPWAPPVEGERRVMTGLHLHLLGYRGGSFRVGKHLPTEPVSASKA